MIKDKDKKDDKTMTKEVMFLDWQMLTVGDNMFDLGVAILHNTNFGLDKDVIADLLRCYFNTLNDVTIKMGLNESVESFEDFSRRFYHDG